MTLHAKLGASNAHRWLACGGSVAAEQAIPETGSSPFALEGTKAHDLAEKALVQGKQPSDLSDDAEMIEHVTTYTDYVRAASVGADSVEYEQRVSYADWVPEGFGTADAVILKGDTIHVCDLKYGKGVRVDADNNPQGMLYALGAYAEFGYLSDFKQVLISIVQPRLDHISEWSISVKDLLKWAEWVSQRAEIALSPDAERVPGEKQCRFCSAKGKCPALMKYTEKIIMSDFDDLDGIASPDALTDAQMRNVLDNKALIEGWLSAVQTVVQDRLESGEGFDGYKLVEGRSLRKWFDDVEAEKALSDLIGDAAFKRSLISPAQAEKIVAKSEKAKLGELIIKPAGKPTMVQESDKRPAISLSGDDFDVVDPAQ